MQAYIKNGRLVIDDKREFAMLLARYNNQEVDIVVKKKTKKRTTPQNNALHLYYQLLATELNDAGYDLKIVLKQEADVPITSELVKEALWKPVQKHITGKDSTAQLSTKEIGEIYEVINRHISEKFGVYVPFPDYNYYEIGE